MELFGGSAPASLATQRMLSMRTDLALPNAPKLKRGGHKGKRTAAGASAAPAAQLCGGRMPGPLSLAALLLGGE